MKTIIDYMTEAKNCGLTATSHLQNNEDNNFPMADDLSEIYDLFMSAARNIEKALIIADERERDYLKSKNSIF